MNILLKNKKINQEIFDRTNEFLVSNKSVSLQTTQVESKELSFGARANLCRNKISKRLFEIMEVKKSNLCFSADYNSFDQLIQVNNKPLLN